jgi:hypothetical protein
MLLLKFKMLWLYRGALADWWHDVWMKDGAAQMCCSGRECGCYGADYADMWEHCWKTRGGRTR